MTLHILEKPYHPLTDDIIGDHQKRKEPELLQGGEDDIIHVTVATRSICNEYGQ